MLVLPSCRMEREFGKRSKRNNDIILSTHTISWRGDILPSQSRCVSFEVLGVQKEHRDPFWHQDFEFLFCACPKSSSGLRNTGSLTFCAFYLLFYMYNLSNFVLFLFHLSLLVPTSFCIQTLYGKCFEGLHGRSG